MRACTQKGVGRGAPRGARQAAVGGPSRRRRDGCFRCGSLKHFIRDCLEQSESAAGAVPTGASGAGFPLEGAERGTVSSEVEIE